MYVWKLVLSMWKCIPVERNSAAERLYW